MLSFSGIIELDEQNEVLKSIGRFNLDWYDEVLIWDPFLEVFTHVKHVDDGYPDLERVIWSIQIVSVFILVLIY